MERREGLIAFEFWPGGGFTFCSVLLSGRGDDGETFLCAKGGWRVGLWGWKITRSFGLGGGGGGGGEAEGGESFEEVEGACLFAEGWGGDAEDFEVPLAKLELVQVQPVERAMDGGEGGEARDAELGGGDQGVVSSPRSVVS
jgi:hypothetical protein